MKENREDKIIKAVVSVVVMCFFVPGFVAALREEDGGIIIFFMIVFGACWLYAKLTKK